MNVDLARLLISPAQTLQEVAACIDANAQGIALVVDDNQHLVGTVVDGDIRRAMLANISMDTPVAEILKRKTAQYAVPVSAPLGTDTEALAELMKTRSVRHVPLLDEHDRVAGLFTMQDMLLDAPPLNVQAVLMAGGSGTRLRPLTENLPKPMLPVGDRPLMERIVGQLRAAGITHINVTTHYLPEKIEAYFGDGSAFGVIIRYVPEDQPLGTAGGVGLIETSDMPLLVMNGDLLTDLDFRAMLDFHREQRAWLTVAVRQYSLTVPYGVVESEGGFVRDLTEKPSLNFFVNAGIYLLEPAAHRLIPSGERMDMPDLIQKLLDMERPVASFPIREYWLDIGQHADYQRALDDYEARHVNP
jgi:dTDP-glucose pyrophosphorylase/CBS domain-containing protein